MKPTDLTDDQLIAQLQQGGGVSGYIEAVRELTRRYFDARKRIAALEASLLETLGKLERDSKRTASIGRVHSEGTKRGIAVVPEPHIG